MPQREVRIHSTAIVHRGADLGQGVVVGPYCVIGASVVLGDDVVLDSHVAVGGRTTVGARTRVWPFASIGTTPQDLKYAGEDTVLECGADNMFREYSNISIGTEGGGGKTVIGSGNLFMVNVHVAHDCIIGDRCVFANGVSLAGHIEVGNHATVGGHTGVHQFCRIGDLAMLAAGSIVVQDAPPYTTIQGNHASPKGLNLIGLRRAGLDAHRIAAVKEMYNLLYRSHLTVEKALERIMAEIPVTPEREAFTAFLRNSKRGVCR